MKERQEWKLKRISKNIKLIDIASNLGITSAYVCMYEKGKTDMNRNLRQKYKQFIEEYKA